MPSLSNGTAIPNHIKWETKDLTQQTDSTTSRAGIITYVDCKNFRTSHQGRIPTTYNRTIGELVVETMMTLLVIEFLKVEFCNGNTLGSGNVHSGAVMPMFGQYGICF